MDTLPPLQRGKGIFVNLTLDGICRLHLSGGHAKILLRIYEEAARWRDKDRSAAPKKAGDAMEKRQKTSLTMCLVAIGIVYGDIGTSPLYVMKSILEGNGGITQINESFIVGAAHDHQVRAHRHEGGQPRRGRYLLALFARAQLRQVAHRAGDAWRRGAACRRRADACCDRDLGG